MTLPRYITSRSTNAQPAQTSAHPTGRPGSQLATAGTDSVKPRVISMVPRAAAPSTPPKARPIGVALMP